MSDRKVALGPTGQSETGSLLPLIERIALGLSRNQDKDWVVGINGTKNQVKHVGWIMLRSRESARWDAPAGAVTRTRQTPKFAGHTTSPFFSPAFRFSQLSRTAAVSCGDFCVPAYTDSSVLARKDISRMSYHVHESASGALVLCRTSLSV
jgi:hypothetical protein